MSIQSWEHFFKPEVRTSGRALVSKGKVSVSQPSDTEIVIFIRATPGFKVSFKSASVESETVIVDCNCPVAKKDQFCKHIWAGLLTTEEKNSDFFENKTEIVKRQSTAKLETQKAPPSEKSQAFAAKQAAYKEKQANYRKEQYQKQKQRLKDYKESKKATPEEIKFPPEVEKALKFFSNNGIELKESMDRETIGSAKKKLARIFHPDIGGSHDEILELNHCTDVLIQFINR